MPSDPPRIGTFVLIASLVAALATTVAAQQWTGCHTPDDSDFDPPYGSCGGGGFRWEVLYSPAHRGYCKYVLSTSSNCRTIATPWYRWYRVWSNPGCTGYVELTTAQEYLGMTTISEGF